ncbi:hypothetical protein KGF57_002157 [Candida theae]|uniref:Uncharacterized protein n=1 Tax=Candida theae TaxID=1198502 RepID=A0AAD5BFH8_9ASCO|nr:uncharacterized protein KGF57_002157 [Candida theae]KAI5959219.1 hypothetical protein KGF57_002157 [Candida theae]
MSIIVREGNTYYQLELNYDTIPGVLAIPASTLFLDFKIYINSHLVTVVDNDELVRSLAARFQPFWNHCLYDSSINISDTPAVTFTLVCKDTVFASNRLPKIHSIQFRLSVLTLDSEINLETLLVAFNYLMVSWVLNEELQYPAIFSPTGRQFIKLNLFWYKKMYYEVLETHLDDEEKVISSYIDIVKVHYTTMKLMSGAETLFDSTRSNRGRKCIFEKCPLSLVVCAHSDSS